MVTVSLSTSLSVEHGPSLTAAADHTLDSYVVAHAGLGPAGSSDAETEIPLLPAGGKVAVLCLTATLDDGAPATIETTLNPSAAVTTTISGSLLIANTSVLETLVGTGERTIGVKNTGSAAVAVTVFAALDT